MSNIEKTLQHNPHIFSPTTKEVVKYTHLDLSFPPTIEKLDEYQFRMSYDEFWRPYEWGHRNGDVFFEHMSMNTPLLTRTNEEYLNYYSNKNWSNPNTKKLQRWREVGDVWIVKSNISSDGYAIIVITGIKEEKGVRYIEFCLADNSIENATDLDIYIQSGVHSSLAYDLVLYEELEGRLFELDKRLLHKIGRIHSETIQHIKIGKTENFNRGEKVFSQYHPMLKRRSVKEFEASILSQEVYKWLDSNQIYENLYDFELEMVKGLSNLEKRHEKLSASYKGASKEFQEIETPYTTHLWKLYNTYGKNLILTSDGELEEESEIVIKDHKSGKEVNINMEFYNNEN